MRPHTLYFHGLPGSAAELGSFGPKVARAASHFHVVARTDALTLGDPAAYFGRLGAQIVSQFPGQPLHLVGFSLGAAAALRVAPLLGGRASQVDLISPAGPLSLGDFLAAMAGAPVFRAALAGRIPFTALTMMQAQAARLAPARMAAALMASAQGADGTLATDPHFIAQLAASLRHSLLAQRAAYRQEILLYVTDWSAELAKVRVPVTIWQGSDDNWTPPAMAQALAAALPLGVELQVQPGLSHFSTLGHYLEYSAAQA